MKKWLTAIALSTMLIFSACGNKEENEKEKEDTYHFPTEEELKEHKDNSIIDPDILEHDLELQQGDSGVEKKIKYIQNPSERDKKILEELESKNQSPFKPIHHRSSYPSLHPTFVNTSAVSPIRGNYKNNVVGKAWDYLGTPYEYGSDRGNDKSFDCSDFTYWIHLYTLGMELPKTSKSQWEYVKKFSQRKYSNLDNAKFGDLLFFMSYKGWQEQDYKGIDVKSQPVAHVGIYVGNGYMVHTASAKTGGVRYDKIKGSHLEYRFIGGGQVVQ